MKKTLFCIVGETASGKDSIIKEVKKQFKMKNNRELKEVVSYTTRPIRENETDGVEHYFISEEEFHKLKNDREDDIIAYTKITNNDYGYEYMALREDVENADIYIIDPNGIKYLKEKSNLNVNIRVIYIYTSFDVREKRAEESRSDFEKEFYKRVEKEKEQFEEFKNNKAYDYIIMNDFDFILSCRKLESIISKYYI